MSQRIFRAFLSATLLIGAVSLVWSKPPDLPMNVKVTCETEQERCYPPAAAPVCPPGCPGCPAMPNYPHPHIEDPAESEETAQPKSDFVKSVLDLMDKWIDQSFFAPEEDPIARIIIASGGGLQPPERQETKWASSFAEWLGQQLGDNYDFRIPECLDSVGSLCKGMTNLLGAGLPDQPSEDVLTERIEIAEDGTVWKIVERKVSAKLPKEVIETYYDQGVAKQEKRIVCETIEHVVTEKMTVPCLNSPAMQSQTTVQASPTLPCQGLGIGVYGIAPITLAGEPAWTPDHRAAREEQAETLPPPTAAEESSLLNSVAKWLDEYLSDNFDFAMPEFLQSLSVIWDTFASPFADRQGYSVEKQEVEDIGSVSHVPSGLPTPMVARMQMPETVTAVTVPGSAYVGYTGLIATPMMPPLNGRVGTPMRMMPSPSVGVCDVFISQPLQFITPSGVCPAGVCPPGAYPLPNPQRATDDEPAEVQPPVSEPEKSCCFKAFAKWLQTTTPDAFEGLSATVQGVVEMFSGWLMTTTYYPEPVMPSGHYLHHPPQSFSSSPSLPPQMGTFTQAAPSYCPGQCPLSPLTVASGCAQCVAPQPTAPSSGWRQYSAPERPNPSCETLAEVSSLSKCIPVRFGSAQVVADLLTAYFTCCPAAVADDANCVWVTAPPICMAEAEQMIQQIDDTFAGTPFTLQIFTLKHAVADEAAGELANYFNKSWDWPVTCGETCRPKVIVLPEVRSNSLIVVAPTCCSEKVETVVLQCDEDSSRSAPACQHCPLAGAAIGAAAGCLTEEPCCPLSAGQRGLLLHQEQHRRLATECLENAVTSVPHCEASTEELIYTICIPVRFSSAQVVAETLSAYFTCCPAAEADSANCVWFTGSRICLDEAEQIVQQIDEAFASTPIQMQTFALHNKIADEVAKDLTACFNGCCHPLVLTLPEVRSNTLIVVMPSSCAEEVSNTIDRVDAGTLHVLRGISGTGWERSLTGVHYERVDGGITPRQETPEGYPEVAWPFGRPHAPAGVTPYYFDPGSPVAVTAASALTEQAVCQVMQTSFAVPARQCPGMLPPMAPVSFPSNARSTNNDQPTHITTDYMGGDIAPRSGYEEQTAPPSSCSAACNGAALGAIAGVCPAAECCHCQQSCPDVPLDAEAYKLHSARHFLEIGRQCEENGDYEMARNCYEEATRVCPGSKYAALANAKLAMATAVVASNRATHGGYETQEEPPASAVATSLIPSRVHEAYRMLQMGERFEQAGDLDNAYRCYQDAHAMCPACDDGRKALEHMMEIEAIRNRQSEPPQGGVEEQEPPANRHRPPYTSEEVDQREQARALYNMAEHALRCGELSTAYIQFQEAHLAFPDCYFGLRSIERMTQIETRAANGENRTNGVNTLGGQKVTPNIPR